MKHFTKSRLDSKLTEVQQLYKKFPNFKTIPHILESNSKGEIIIIEIDDKKIIAWLKQQGFS